MAQKLGIPFTDDLMKLGSNSDISDALIEKAVAAGKSEVEINKAMASLWGEGILLVKQWKLRRYWF